MKNILRLIALAMAAAMLLSGCVSDPVEPEGPTDETGSITFTLPGSTKKAQTYVDSTGDEDKVEGLAIYMFNTTTGKLERIFKGADITTGTNSDNNPTATIDLTERFGPKTFFFLANGNGITKELDDVKFNKTLLTDFQESLCDVQTVLPKAPMLMSFKREIVDIEKPTPEEKKIGMTRRVARFDVENVAKHPTDDTKSTNFTLERIVVGNVNQRGYIFGDALGTPEKDLTPGNVAFIPFGTQDNANTGLSTSVFYTYPTTLGTDKTDITFEGKFQGETKTYSVQLDADFEIEANKRYILKAKRVEIKDIEFEVTVKDWEAGVDIDAESEKNRIDLTPLVVTEGGASIVDDGKTLELTKATAQTVLKFTTKTYRAEGTKVEIEHLSGTPNLNITCNNPAPKLTYGARYEQDYVIKIAKDAVTDAQAVIKIINVSNPFERTLLKVVRNNLPDYPGVTSGDKKPIRFAGLWWAPVNEGATTTNGNNAAAGAGKMFQWGREYVGWTWNEATSTKQAGPVTIDQAKNSYGTTFITNDTIIGSYDWANPHDHMLWNPSNPKGPCPTGWRMPTRAELELVVKAFQSQKAAIETNKLMVQGDLDGDKLYFQFGGFRNFNSAAYTDQNDEASYWTCEAKQEGDTHYATRLYMSKNGTVNMNDTAYRANGYFVRCILDK